MRPATSPHRKPPPERGFRVKRLKGFEPSTFCMASRRSSQLSYSRTRRDSSLTARGRAVASGSWVAGGPACLVLVAVLGLLGGAPARSAAAQPAMVVWAGPLVPGTALHGVRLKADGSGARLVVGAGHRAGGKVTTAGSFSPAGAQLAAIRAAAKAAFAAAGVTAESGSSLGAHGSYAAATVEVGGKTRTLLGVNASPPPCGHCWSS